MSEQDLLHVLPPTSRFQLYPTPIVNPGKCAVCGAVDRPVLDFGMTLQFYGAVMLCVTCLTEAGAAIGLVPKMDVDRAEGLAQTNLDEQLAARNLKAIPNELVTTLDLAFGALSSVVFHVMSSNSDLVEPSPNADTEIIHEELSVNDASVSESVEGADGTSGESELGDSGSSEQSGNPIIGEGPLGLSDGSSDGERFFDFR